MEVIENEVVSGKTIVLDEKHFVNGTYKKCVLIYSGGEFGMVNTKFEDCQISLTGPAQRTASFLQGFGLTKPSGIKPDTPQSVQ